VNAERGPGRRERRGAREARLLRQSDHERGAPVRRQGDDEVAAALRRQVQRIAVLEANTKWRFAVKWTASAQM
jgi:hypothetical protein